MPAGTITNLPANTWTKVLWGAGYFTHIASFSIPAIRIEWRRYAASPVPYSDGTHVTSNPYYATIAGFYSDFWFKSPVAMIIQWTAA